MNQHPRESKRARKLSIGAWEGGERDEMMFLLTNVVYGLPDVYHSSDGGRIKRRSRASPPARLCARANVFRSTRRTLACRTPLNGASAPNWPPNVEPCVCWHCEPQVRRNKRALPTSKPGGDIWGFQSSKCNLLL